MKKNSISIPFLYLLSKDNPIERWFLYVVWILIPLPFILPQSDIITSTTIFQYLGIFVPAAQKLAHLALYPNVYEAYIVLVGYITLICGFGAYIGGFPENQNKLTKIAEDMKVYKAIFAVGKALLLGFPLVFIMLYIFYVFPFSTPEVTNVEDAHTRGQLMFNALLQSRVGLFLFGICISIAVVGLWYLMFALFSAAISFPYLLIKKIKRTK